jgi:hypothetical protein
MALVTVEHLSSKCVALSSSPVLPKNKIKIKNKNERKMKELHHGLYIAYMLIY